MEITIPYNYEPRPYQLPVLRYIDNGGQRAVQVRHRRSGKDKTDFAAIVVKKALERVGLYFYILPTYSQGKKVIRDGIDKQGYAIRNHIPPQLIKSENSTDMKIELKNGSIIQVVGTDGRNIDRLVGTNPVGAVFSEYSLQNPRAWDLIRPILMENGGRAIFNFTPRGKNHGYDLYEMAKDNTDWFCQLLTVEDTCNADGNRIVTDEMIEQERKSGMDEDLLLQEYYCSFEASIQGAYYSNQMKDAESQQRLTLVPYQQALTVDTYRDIGVNDTTAIRFSQTIGREVHLIDYLESSGEGLEYYLGEITKKGYNYGTHHFPHDMKAREFGSGKSREDTLREFGIRNYVILPQLSISEGIDAARRLLPHCYIDKEKCKQGIRCLKEYHKQRDETRKTFKEHPEHDWSSNGADAFRYLAQTVLKKITKPIPSQSTSSRTFIDPATGVSRTAGQRAIITPDGHRIFIPNK